MSTLDKIAFFQNRRDEVPNQVLAKELAETKNQDGIREIVQNLENKNKNVRSDCLKVLYEIGYLDPGLIADYYSAFPEITEEQGQPYGLGSHDRAGNHRPPASRGNLGTG